MFLYFSFLSTRLISLIVIFLLFFIFLPSSLWSLIINISDEQQSFSSFHLISVFLKLPRGFDSPCSHFLLLHTSVPSCLPSISHRSQLVSLSAGRPETVCSSSSSSSSSLLLFCLSSVYQTLPPAPLLSIWLAHNVLHFGPFMSWPVCLALL